MVTRRWRPGTYVDTQGWTQRLTYFNTNNLNRSPVFGSYTASLVGPYAHVFVFPVENVQYMYNYYHYISGGPSVIGITIRRSWALAAG